MAPAQFLRPSRPGAARRAALCLCLAAQPLAGCAELEGAKPGDAAGAAASSGAGAPAAAAAAPAVSPDLLPAPAVFEATGMALWDGRRTLQGVWVAHPQASTARRVRIYNAATGAAADGALFARDAVLSGPTMLVSSDAARLLGLAPGAAAELRVVAVTPRAAGAGDLAAASRGPAAAPSAAAPSASARPAAAPSATGRANPALSAAVPSAAVRTAAAPAAAAPPAAIPRAATSPAAADVTSRTTLALDQEGSGAPGDLARARTGSGQPPASAAPPSREATSEPPSRVAAASSAAEPAREASDPRPSPGPSAIGEQETAARGQAQDARPAPPAREPATPAAATAGPAPADAGRQDDLRRAPATHAGAAPEAPPEAPPEAAPEAAPGAVGALAQPYVQAGLFAVAGNAERLIRRMEAAGLPALGKPVQLPAGPATRVLAGPFATAAERDAARRRIRAMGLDDAIPVAR